MSFNSLMDPRPLPPPSLSKAATSFYEKTFFAKGREGEGNLGRGLPLAIGGWKEKTVVAAVAVGGIITFPLSSPSLGGEKGLLKLGRKEERGGASFHSLAGKYHKRK